MRRLAVLAVLGLGCAGDDGSNDGGDGGETTDPTTTTSLTGDGGPSGGTNASTGAPMTDGSTTTPGATTGGEASTGTAASTGDTGATGDSSGGSANGPTLASVSWTHVPGCTPGVGSDVTLTISASDPDDDLASLVYAGNVVGCTPSIDAAMVTLLCPQAAAYAGSVTVTDPAGHSDQLDFTVEVCTDGMAP